MIATFLLVLQLITAQQANDLIKQVLQERKEKCESHLLEKELRSSVAMGWLNERINMRTKNGGCAITLFVDIVDCGEAVGINSLFGYPESIFVDLEWFTSRMQALGYMIQIRGDDTWRVIVSWCG